MGAAKERIDDELAARTITYSRTQAKPDGGTSDLVERQHGQVYHGVARMEAAAALLTTTKRWCFFSSIFVFSYIVGLDFMVRNTYVAYATSSFHNHSLLATINVIRGVVAGAIQPSAARLADVFGRVEIFCIAVFLITAGTLAETFSVNIEGFAGGAILHQLGYTLSVMTIEIMIADFTAMKSRLFFSFVPNWPILVNTWISGNVTSSVLSVTTWKWGIGMFAIMNPICALPLIIFMLYLKRQARKANQSEEEALSPSRLRNLGQLFWDLDIIGVLILTSALAMTLIPLTLAGGVKTKWKDAGIITPIVLGFLLIPVLLIWERKISYPMLPYHLLKQRTVWACLGISCLFPFIFVIHGNYLYTLLVVSYDFSIAGATRVAGLYNFCATLVGATLGFLVIKFRRLKELIVIGAVMWFIGGGMVYHYRGGSSSKAGIIGAEIMIGSGAGFFSWTTYVLIQTAARHEHLSILISLIFTVNYFGQAFGNCVSGALWTQTLYEELDKNLVSFNNETLAAAVYASPFTVVPTYAIGTPEREAITESYRYIQRILTITALCLMVPMLALALVLRNPRLSNQQTQPEAEQPGTSDQVEMRSKTGELAL
ncbi:hypothetical protein RBB50_011380 [Rhinocladiella similis]